MRLDKFLSKALYSDNGYYYNKKPIGKKNDFITAPEISQMFGEIIAIYLYYNWKTKINSKFNFIELGPGLGTLFLDIYKSVSHFPEFLNSADISFIEINRKLKKLQKHRIRKVLKGAKWLNSINYKSKFPSIIYSNEFFDCFPVRHFVYNKSWTEKYVFFNKEENKHYFKNKLVNNEKLLLYLKKYTKEKILEISFDRDKYFEKICKLIKNKGGIFLTVDYGYFKNNNNFTLQAVQNHKYSNILENIGEKDISSHVNFGVFRDIAENHNLKIDEYCTQREFLIKYGIKERKKNLINSKNITNINLAIDRLINKKQMGDLFKFIVISNL